MPRRTRTQRAGKGSSVYKGSIRAKTRADYGSLGAKETQKAQITGFFTDPVHSSVIAALVDAEGRKQSTIAAEGMVKRQTIEAGEEAQVSIGNILPLKSIPEGCPMFALEKRPGDGGAMVKASGLYALIITKDKRSAFVKLPSGKTMQLNPDCRATIGCCAGGGRTDKPFVKAGARFFAKKAKHKKYPLVRGVAMNPNSHPFGGSQHHAGKSKSTSRHSPPGRKVGAIASKRTGRKKK